MHCQRVWHALPGHTAFHSETAKHRTYRLYKREAVKVGSVNKEQFALYLATLAVSPSLGVADYTK